MFRPMPRKRLIEESARRLGLVLETSRPGDGVTRYEFQINVDPDTGSVGRVVGFCLGAREAEVFLRGWAEGMLYQKTKKEEPTP